ncbi:zinc-dependent metalloprotease family protein [Natronospira sp.]|uniref:zinc-dependent metalloprotease family protein n=1 Tax=Natronospira sp. TaxID=2024970 RepID=UPI0038736ADA
MRHCCLGLVALILSVSSGTAVALSEKQRPVFLQVDQSQPRMSEARSPSDSKERQPLIADLEAISQYEHLTFLDAKGHALELRQTEIQQRGPGSYAWHGQVHDSDQRIGSATFTIRQERVHGLISLREGRYRVSTDGEKRVWLDRIDPDAAPAQHPKHLEQLLTGSTEPSPQARSQTAGATAKTAVVDVLAFYTDDTIAEHEDEAGLRLFLTNALDMANTALVDSEVDHRFRLVGLIHWSYQEDPEGMFQALNSFRNDSQVEQLLDLYAADLGAGFGVFEDFCGVAYLLTEYTRSFKNGLSINNVNNAYPCQEIQVLAHEMGHNLGLAHDPDNAGDPESLIEPFAYGHVEVDEFSSVMAYHPGCGGGVYDNCFGVDFFSNPDIIDPDSGLAVGIEGERDNAEVLRRSMSYATDWRQPPASLADALGVSGHVSTEGDGLWTAQNQVALNSHPSVISGPVYAEEESWLRWEPDAEGIDSLAFSLRGTPNTQGKLRIMADEEELLSLEEFPEEWVRHELDIPKDVSRISWVWQSQERPSTGGSLSAVYLGDVNRESSPPISGGSGGCSLNPNGSLDPTWLLFLFGLLLMAFRRAWTPRYSLNLEKPYVP